MREEKEYLSNGKRKYHIGILFSIVYMREEKKNTSEKKKISHS
jgi:hypothetical protein